MVLMRIGASIAFFLALLNSGSLRARSGGIGLAQCEGRIIRRIEIVRRNVFDDRVESSDLFIYRWANALHVTTREHVIRRELLFTEGDSLDVERIIESRRNIRLTELIEDVEITATPVGADSVDLNVVSSDLWTTKLSPMFETGGGNHRIGFLFAESNFLGSGWLIDTAGQTGTDQDGFSVLYRNRRVFGTRLAAAAGHSDFTYGRYSLVQLEKPRYSLVVHTRFSAGYSRSEGTARLFDRGSEYFRYRYEMNDARAEGAYSFGERGRIDLVAAFDYAGRTYRPDEAASPSIPAIPPDETLSYPSIGTEAAYTRYGEERYLDEAGTPEDVTYGAAVLLRTGKSSRRFGADYESWINSVSMRCLAKPFARLIVGARDAVSWHAQGGARRIHHTAEGFAYVKTGAAQVLAFRGLTSFAWRERPSYQVLLGGDNGLRGHRYFALSGDRLALGNVEYRFFLPLEILSVRIGGAAFLDCGYVWRPGEKIDLARMKSDVGVGLRFGLAKSSTARVVSVDVARPLGGNDLYVTIGSGLVFSLDALGR